MPHVPQRSTLAGDLADMDRRLRNLEATARNGLSRIAFAFQNDGIAVPTYDAWFKTDGVTTFPSITLVTGRRCIIQVGVLATQFGSASTFKAKQGLFGFGLDGLNPDDTPTFTQNLRQFYFDSNNLYLPMAFAVTFGGTAPGWGEALEPGVHTFQVWCWATYDGAGSVDPVFDDAWIMVTPLDVV